MAYRARQSAFKSWVADVERCVLEEFLSQQHVGRQDDDDDHSTTTPRRGGGGTSSLAKTKKRKEGEALLVRIVRRLVPLLGASLGGREDNLDLSRGKSKEDDSVVDYDFFFGDDVTGHEDEHEDEHEELEEEAEKAAIEFEVVRSVFEWLFLDTGPHGCLTFLLGPPKPSTAASASASASAAADHDAALAREEAKAQAFAALASVVRRRYACGIDRDRRQQPTTTTTASKDLIGSREGDWWLLINRALPMASGTGGGSGVWPTVVMRLGVATKLVRLQEGRPPHRRHSCSSVDALAGARSTFLYSALQQHDPQLLIGSPPPPSHHHHHRLPSDTLRARELVPTRPCGVWCG
jgi:hypothetical protein